jgi:hypothetical protein
MQILNELLPYVTGAFATWCAAGVFRTALEIWHELRPERESRPEQEPVRIPRGGPTPAFRRAA